MNQPRSGVRPPSPTQRLRHVAALAPWLGLLLLLPPLVALFTAPVRVAGIPLIVLYLFSLWALLIVLAFWLARRLNEPSTAADGERQAPTA